MKVDPITQVFEERLQEIDAYLDLLDALERQVQQGPPRIGGAPITSQQQKILYSSVYLQLYNLVEATATWCVEAVAGASASGQWKPGDLIEKLRSEWVRTVARTHTDLNAQNRFATTFEFCDRLIKASPITTWTVETGGGGNWDDMVLEDIADRLGFDLRLTEQARKGVKRIVRDDKGTLVLVRFLRNRLAHGSISFAECGEGVTVSELREMKDRAAVYLREVVKAFRGFIDEHMYVTPDKRPAGSS